MPRKIYYGPQTKAALANFPFSIPPLPAEFIYAIVEIKQAAALSNQQAGILDSRRARAIARACQEILAGKLGSQFPVPSLQGGAGTSANMNVNEVLAARAAEILKQAVHPNDHVNKSQSTNDVNPSALKIAAIRLTQDLLAAGDALAAQLQKKARQFVKIAKLGRTHLQDAVPTTLGAEFASYAAVMGRNQSRIKAVLPYLYELNLGGTAIGNCLNAPPRYQRAVYQQIRKITGLPLRPAANLMSQTSSQADFVMLSGALEIFTLDLSKIASDLRLLASGPGGGLGEIKLKGLQPGSSIMPGKVNPVLPEAVNQLHYLAHGNHSSIVQAARDSQLELGVMGPIIADRLIESLKLTAQVCRQFGRECVAPLSADSKACQEHLENSTAYSTLLTPALGYDVVSQAVKEALATGQTLRAVITSQGLLTDARFDEIVR